ncbi:MAG: hypothetical protein OEO21_01725 [Candidatus Krumholzibacteria bacterium]|nr:hypothetical protein [Candidatus Krumholzibacteria bacterium]
MTVTLVEQYSVVNTLIAGVAVKCTTYKIGDTYHCVVSNLSPGANVARSSGPTPDAALVAATKRAKELFRYA